MLAVIRGAGDIATGITLRLYRAGIKIVMTDLPQPTSIRRTVCFSEAIRHGTAVVEGVEACLAENAAEARKIAESGRVAVLVDPEAACVKTLRPDALVDAILAKKNMGTRITDAPVVVAVGPGFTAGVDCHAAVETMRGHTLGRVLYEGSPLPNTGVFEPKKEIGAQVKKGEVAAVVSGKPMLCKIDGCLRGLMQAGAVVFEGMKCGDVDPRGIPDNCTTASDKAIAVGGGVLEAILHFTHALD